MTVQQALDQAKAKLIAQKGDIEAELAKLEVEAKSLEPWLAHEYEAIKAAVVAFGARFGL